MIALACLAFTLVLAGFACLSAAMQKHQRDLFATSPGHAKTRFLRAAGWLLITASLLCAMAGWQISTGIVAWVGMMTIAAVLIVLLLTYRPRAIASIVLVSFVLPLLALALAA